ncbi:MAG TPA: DUF2487 family protein [Bacilli bacterium]
MKFSDIKQAEWANLQPYLDTCLLPLTGLSGLEEPWELTKRLEQLRDLMELVEVPFKGRVITYPAIHYGRSSVDYSAYIDQICTKIKSKGMVYIILISAANENLEGITLKHADLLIEPKDQEMETSVHKKWISDQIIAMWAINQSANL